MSIRTRRIGLVAIIAAGAAGVVWAQGAAQTPPTGTLAALTEEVHQLRLAIQTSAGTQTQVQATAVYLSAEQSRLLQLSARLDKVQTDLRARIAENQKTAAHLKDLQSQLATASPEVRNAITEMIKEAKPAYDRDLEEENQLRARESELMSMIQTEEARWQDLLARLEALIKK